jgi:hypothetical protein
MLEHYQLSRIESTRATTKYLVLNAKRLTAEAYVPVSLLPNIVCSPIWNDVINPRLFV